MPGNELNSAYSKINSIHPLLQKKYVKDNFQGIDTTLVVTEGDPNKEMLEIIDKCCADLAVIGSMNSNMDQLNFVSARYSEHLDLSRAISEWNEHVEALRRTEELRLKAEADRQASEKARLEAQDREKQKAEEVTDEPVNVAQEPENVANQPEYAEPEPETGTYWAEFRIYDATLDQMKALTAFIKNNNMHMTILKDENGNPRKGH